ncbi:MAG: AAA family ATPase, partial [Spirochaetaceae bacterium]|nr:AAA family ATPase [Spirochaetaceae bacterium]
MSYVIAITGKGGVGKTTIAGLAVRSLIEAGRTPVLAVDADPNSCLDAALGVTVRGTVGSIREEAREAAGQGMGAGISKQQLLELRIAESLVESEGFDLIAMGRPEGAGCYCYANNVLKDALGRLAGNYGAVVLDNEAGLENLSRRIVREVDLLVLAGDATYNGLRTLQRLRELADEMDVRFGALAVIVNRCRGQEMPPSARELVDGFDGAVALALPFDPQISEYSETGRTIFDLPSDNLSLARIAAFLGGIMA